MLPKEGRFHELLGEIALAQKQPQGSAAVLPEGDRPELRLLRLLSRRRRRAVPGRQSRASRGMVVEELAAAAHCAGRLLPRHDRARARRSSESDGVLPRGRRLAEPHRRDGRGRVRAHGPAAESRQLRRRRGSVRRAGPAAGGRAESRAGAAAGLSGHAGAGRCLRAHRAAGCAGACRCGVEAGRAGRGAVRHRQHPAGAAAVSEVQSGRRARGGRSNDLHFLPVLVPQQPLVQLAVRVPRQLAA